MPVKIMVSGPREEVKMVYNILNASPDCLNIQSHAAHTRKNLVDGSQTIEGEFKAAKRYQERKEKPLSRDKQGWVYVMETPYEAEPPYIGIYKLGSAADVQKRKKQHVKLPFAVKTVASIYSQDRIALERYLLNHFTTVRIQGSEFVKLTAKNLSDIQAMG